MSRPEIIEEGKGRLAKCYECGTMFRFFPENVWMGGRDRDSPHVYCPREGCKKDGSATAVSVREALRKAAS